MRRRGRKSPPACAKRSWTAPHYEPNPARNAKKNLSQIRDRFLSWVKKKLRQTRRSFLNPKVNLPEGQLLGEEKPTANLREVFWRGRPYGKFAGGF
jgi:hypothetical protein